VVFAVPIDGQVYFSVVDENVLDNRGGVSIHLESVPEPGTALLLTSGALGLMCLHGFRDTRQRRQSEKESQ